MSNNQNEKPSASSTDEYNNEKLFTFDLDDINLYLSTDGVHPLIDSTTTDLQAAQDYSNNASQHWPSNFWTLLSSSGQQQVSHNQGMLNAQQLPTLPPIDAMALLRAITGTQHQNATSFTGSHTHATDQTSPNDAQQLTTMLVPLEPITAVATSGPRKKINIDAFHEDREITMADAIVYCLKTKKTVNVNNGSEIQDVIQELKQLKKNIKQTAQAYIHNDVLTNSKALTLTDGTIVPSRRIDDLTEVWAKNESLAEQLWTILVKRYADMGEWELIFEEQVMDSLHLENVEDETMGETLKAGIKDRNGNVTKVIHRKKSKMRGNKGCVAKMVRLVKRDLIKQFNRATEKTHMTIMTSVNPVVTVDDEGKKKYKKQNIKTSTFSENLHLNKRAKVCLLLTNLYSFLLDYYITLQNGSNILLLHYTTPPPKKIETHHN